MVQNKQHPPPARKSSRLPNLHTHNIGFPGKPPIHQSHATRNRTNLVHRTMTTRRTTTICSINRPQTRKREKRKKKEEKRGTHEYRHLLIGQMPRHSPIHRIGGWLLLSHLRHRESLCRRLGRRTAVGGDGKRRDGGGGVIVLLTVH